MKKCFEWFRKYYNIYILLLYVWKIKMLMTAVRKLEIIKFKKIYCQVTEIEQQFC